MIKFRTSIRLNLLFLFSISILIVICSSILFNIIFLEIFYINESKEIFEDAVQQVEKASYTGNIKDLEDVFFSINTVLNVTTILVDENFIPTISTHITNPNIKIPIEKELIDIILKNHNELRTNDIYMTIDKDDEMLSNMLYIRRLEDKSYIILLRPLKMIRDNIRIANDFYIIAGMISLCLSSIFIIKFSRHFTKPIIEMSKITKNMSNLNFSEVIKYNEPNELGILANSVNLLSDKLEENIKDLKDEIEFQKVLSRNMSHELKTPIAVIKGYSEGLAYGVASTKEEQEEYLQVIVDECNRMDHLVQEILSLSKLNSENYTLRNIEKFSTSLIEEELIKNFSAILKKEHINFSRNVDIFDMSGNFELIIQAINNFISNAIKYGNKESIDLLISQDVKYIIFKVFNTGENIPHSEIDIIFETFYKIDKARSRSMNSHGVGLSTVKSVAKLHFGEAYAKNLFNGVEFTLKISKNI